MLGHLDALVAPGGQVLAHEVGPDRQLPVAAVDHHRQLHGAGPPPGGERLEGGADGPAGEKDVVDEDHDAPGDVEGQVGDLLGEHGAQPDVVAVKRDVDGAEGHRHPLDLLEHRGEPFGERHAAGLQPDDDNVFQPAVALDDLVGDAHQGPSNLVGVHDLGTGNKNAPCRARRISLCQPLGLLSSVRPLWTRFTSEASL